MCTTVLHGGVCHRTSTPHKSGNKLKKKKMEGSRQSSDGGQLSNMISKKEEDLGVAIASCAKNIQLITHHTERERDMAIASIDTMRTKLFLSRLISRYSIAAGL